jgi:hypothetical protein
MSILTILLVLLLGGTGSSNVHLTSVSGSATPSPSVVSGGGPVGSPSPSVVIGGGPVG